MCFAMFEWERVDAFSSSLFTLLFLTMAYEPFSVFS
jgi:hypothetical protein